VEIVHEIVLFATDSQQRALGALGIEYSVVESDPDTGENEVHFDLADADPRWKPVRKQLMLWRELRAVVRSRTEFTKEEVDATRWFAFRCWQNGYPEPDSDSFGYIQATYDISNQCDKCKIGMTQNAPFQMKREPKWGRRSIMQFFWVYEEVFVKPDLWASVFAPAGVKCRPVNNTKGLELSTVVQLFIEEEVPVLTKGLGYHRCRKCGGMRYEPLACGPFPVLQREPKLPVVRTNVYFGDGQPERQVLMRYDIKRAIEAGGFRGAMFDPALPYDGRRYP